MKKVGAVFLIFISFVFLIWVFSSQIISFIMSHDFKIPISIQKLELRKDHFYIADLEIKNLKKIESDKALFSKEIFIQSSLKQLLGKTLTFDLIHLKDIEVNIEFYDSSGKENNWVEILKVQSETKASNSPYLIKRILFENLHIFLYKNGKKSSLANIDKLELQNISSDSGFPSNELEKAILSSLMKSIFLKVGLQNLIEEIEPQNLIPNLFHAIPFIGK